LADHRARLELGIVPVTTAPVVAQVSHSAQQLQLRQFLRGCDVVALTRPKLTRLARSSVRPERRMSPTLTSSASPAHPALTC
jgi:hypothetical protein